jgi:hypothetical protein
MSNARRALFTPEAGGVAMRFECKTKTEKAWIVASVSILVVYKLLGGSPPGYYGADTLLEECLKLAMIALSFPLGGLTMFALHDARFWCDGCRDLEWMLDWSTLLFAGYIQWFWLLPEFLRGRKLIIVNLKQRPETISPDASAPIAEPPATALDAAPRAAREAVPRAASEDTPRAACEAAPLPAFDAAAFVPRLAEFDEAGLSALGRVFQAQSHATRARVAVSRRSDFSARELNAVEAAAS